MCIRDRFKDDITQDYDLLILLDVIFARAKLDVYKRQMCTHKCKVRAQTDTITLKGGVNMKRDKHLGIRMDSQLHKKLVYIAEYEGRSLNWQEMCIRDSFWRGPSESGAARPCRRTGRSRRGRT